MATPVRRRAAYKKMMDALPMHLSACFEKVRISEN